MLIPLLVTATAVATIAAFNLDVRNPVAVSGKIRDAYFGYAVAIHKYDGQTWLLVGAPKENRTGNAYKCKKTQNTFDCRVLHVVTRRSRWGPDNRIGSWLGATVASSRGNALVCAPLFGREFGLCHLSKDNLNSFDTYFKLNSYRTGHSAIISSDGQRIYTGSSFRGASGLIMTDIETAKSDVYYSPWFHDDPPYAVAEGNIFRGGKGVAVSINFRVLLLQNISASHFPDRNTLRPLNGKQVSEIFGASLSVTDINGDGLDDIIVGAPCHTDYSAHEIKFEVGAVYVYLQRNSEFSGESDLILRGKHDGGRFGHAVAALGDINGDGFNDVAVGAPYAGSGVVYIHLGSESGLKPNADQEIQGEQIRPSLLSFGAGFGAGSVDLDGNRFNDVIVGAYASDTVVYLPSRPVINFDIDIRFIPELINLDNKTCVLNTVDGKELNVACATMEYCLFNGGKSFDGTVSVDVTIRLDVKQPQRPRLRFLQSDQLTKTAVSDGLNLKAGQRICNKRITYVVDDISDKISPMEAEISVSMREESWPASPLQNPHSARNVSKSLVINKNCKNNLICVPDLQLSVTMNMGQLLQGSSERLVVDATIYNAGEDAFASYFQLHMASALNFINTGRNDSDFSVQCSPPEDAVVRCHIGNPMPANSTVQLRFYLQPVPDVTNHNQDVKFHMEAFSVNKEEPSTFLDNRADVSLSFHVETDLYVDGRSGVSDINVTVTNPELGPPALINRTDWPEFTHFYEIRSTGPSDILGVDLVILFPTMTSEGYELSQLTGQPTVTQGEASCDLLELEEEQLNNGDAGDINATLPLEALTLPDDGKDLIIRCRTKHLTRNDRVVIRLSARVSAEAVLNGSESQLVIASMMKATVTSLPFGLNRSIIEEKTATATTTVRKFVVANPEALKLSNWLIPVVSAVGASIILAVIAVILYKLGFFKRLHPVMDQKRCDPILTDEPKDDVTADAEHT